MTLVHGDQAADFDSRVTARRFVSARLSAHALPGFPGVEPTNMSAGYQIQDAAIDLWPDEIAGWKVGWIAPDLQPTLGAERVMGPVFRRNVVQATADPTPLMVIPGGFAAVEAEYVYLMGENAPAGKTDWTRENALELVENEFVGVEFAGSPLATINVLGPTVVASDFGNNAGLILGRPIPDWRNCGEEWPACETWVDGVMVGRGAPNSLSGGPAGALAFLLNACAARGRPLKRGQLVTTGAATGIHDIKPGQSARIVFDGLDEIRCIARAAQRKEV